MLVTVLYWLGFDCKHKGDNPEECESLASQIKDSVDKDAK